MLNSLTPVSSFGIKGCWYTSLIHSHQSIIYGFVTTKRISSVVCIYSSSLLDDTLQVHTQLSIFNFMNTPVIPFEIQITWIFSQKHTHGVRHIKCTFLAIVEVIHYSSNPNILQQNHKISTQVPTVGEWRGIHPYMSSTVWWGSE